MNKTGIRCFLNTRSKFNTEEDSASEASTVSLGIKRLQSWFYFLENFCLKINGINKGASIK
jgi:hypothetical protein